jgi:hypothetical protein
MGRFFLICAVVLGALLAYREFVRPHAAEARPRLLDDDCDERDEIVLGVDVPTLDPAIKGMACRQRWAWMPPRWRWHCFPHGCRTVER